MAVGVEIATAYVSIVPSFRGIKGNLTRGLQAAMGVSGDSLEAPLVSSVKKAAAKAAAAASTELESGMRVGTAKAAKGVTTTFEKLGKDISALDLGKNAGFGRLTQDVSNFEYVSSRVVTSLSSRFSGFGTSVSNAFKSFSSSSAQTETWGQKLFSAIGKADDAVVRFGANIGTKLNNSLGGFFSNAGSRMLDLAGASDKTAASFKNMGSGLVSGLATGAIGMAALGTTAVVAGTAILGVGLAVAGINRLNTLQQANIAFQTMTGSAEKAKAIMADLTTFAKTTPFPLDDIAAAGKTLFAMGQSAEKLVPTLKAAGDAAAAMGTGSQGMKDISFIMGQIITKGKLEGDELIQLAERGVNASAILGNMLKVNARDVGDKVKDMGLSGKEAVDLLVKGIEEGTNGINGQTAKMGGMLEQFKNTWEGKWSDMKAAFGRLGATIFAPLFTGGQDAMGKVSKLLDQIGKDWPENMRKLGKALSDAGIPDALRKVGDAFEKIGKAMEPALRGFKDLSPAVLAGIGVALRSLVSNLEGLAQFMKDNPEVVRALGIGLVVVAGALAVIAIVAGIAMGAMLLFLVTVVALIGGIVLGVAWLGQWLIENVPGFFEAVWEAIKTAAAAFWEFIKELFRMAGVDIDTIVKTIKDLFTGNWSALKDDIFKLTDELTGGLLSKITDFSFSWGGLWDGIKDLAGGAIRGLADIVMGPIMSIVGAFWMAVDAANALINAIAGVNNSHVNTAISFPAVPKFATGGVVTGPTLGLIGEAGPEAVMPLDKLQNFVNMNSGGVQGGGVYVIDPTGADKALVEFLRRAVRTEGRGNVQKAFGY